MGWVGGEERIVEDPTSILGSGVVILWSYFVIFAYFLENQTQNCFLLVMGKKSLENNKTM